MDSARPMPPSPSSRDADAQAVVHVEEPGGPLGLVDDEQRGNSEAVHHPERLGGEMAGGDGLGILVHDLADAAGEQIVVHVPPQIAVGDDANEAAVIAAHADAAEAL